MTQTKPPQCMVCKHLKDQWTCEAFPDGIPDKILTWEWIHTKPYPRDHGIRFEPMED